MSYVDNLYALDAPNGVVYVSSNDDNLYALNVASGEILWNYIINDHDHAVESSPDVDNGVVYIGSGARDIYAFANRTNSNNSLVQYSLQSSQ